jgi:beta-catenin-like protein 1
LPASGNKRKLPDNPTPEMLKKMKMDITPPPIPENGSPQGKGKMRAVYIEDEEDIDLPRNFAPGGDADYFVEEDDEGRFFGGGLTSEQKTILNIFDSAGEEGVQEDVSNSIPERNSTFIR